MNILILGVLKTLQAAGLLVVGSATIATGDTDVTVTKAYVKASSYIFLTADNATFETGVKQLQVTAKAAGSFKIESEAAAAADTVVHFLLINL